MLVGGRAYERLNAMGKLYHPEAFQGSGHLRARSASRSYFEGWYVKCFNRDKTARFAFIPGVFIGRTQEESHAFLQVLDGSNADYEYIRFPLDEFEVLDSDSFSVRVGANYLSQNEIELELNQGKFEIRGRLSFKNAVSFPVKLLSPGIMGPFAFTPFMECYHGLVSLNHEITGSLQVNGRECIFDGGKGYIEKDWGRSFPSAYVWMQSNHFKNEGSLFVSVARIPWLTGSFRGFIAALFYQGKLKRFATYTGAKLEFLKITDKTVDLAIEDKSHRLDVSARRSHGALLMAPYEHSMIERVSETMTSEIRFQLTGKKTGEKTEDKSQDSALEVQGKLEQIADETDIKNEMPPTMPGSH